MSDTVQAIADDPRPDCASQLNDVANPTDVGALDIRATYPDGATPGLPKGSAGREPSMRAFNLSPHSSARVARAQCAARAR
jgi:hypothetical protein